MEQIDYYAVLGLLPGADNAVIRAAYRALIQQYHPDHWSGDQDLAHHRSCEINQAFAVLGDPKRRQAYDKTRESINAREYKPNDTNEETDSFKSALNALNDPWTIACSFYTDLPSLRSRLERFSTALAFWYVLVILESRNYRSRLQIANTLEEMFLTQHFGTNKKIHDYARTLFANGHKEVARSLNQYVSVLGPETDADTIISRINHQPQKTNNQDEQALNALIRRISKIGLSATRDKNNPDKFSIHHGGTRYTYCHSAEDFAITAKKLLSKRTNRI